MEYFEIFLNKISQVVWGPPLILFLIGTGVFLTVRLRGMQFWSLAHSLRLALIERKEKGDAEGDITHFQALMTALSATVGTGNIAGVATAIAAGGPGALFWMWITALFGMGTKYAEAVLAVRFRVMSPNGTMSGGPMYYLSNGLGQKWLGLAFAFFTAVAAFGIGNMVQSNSVADAMEASFHVPPFLTGLILAGATALVIIGGIRSIARTATALVPVMVVFYLLASGVVVLLNLRAIPEVVRLILIHAFTPTAATGGFLGSAVLHTIRFGVARGVFSNESGLGSSPIAAAAAQTRDPVRQALVSMTQTFIDTIVICSFTGFAIISTGLWTSGKTGAELTTQAFSHSLPGDSGGVIVALGLILFAYSTILGWCYYGEKSIEYLFGQGAIKPYRILFVIMVAMGSFLKLNIVWTFSDIMNGLMAIPNLIGLVFLSGVVARESRRYFSENR